METGITRTTRFHVEVHPRLCNELQKQVDSIELIFRSVLPYSGNYILQYYEVRRVYALTECPKEKQKFVMELFIQNLTNSSSCTCQ
jgi:hypothetical protein